MRCCWGLENCFATSMEKGHMGWTPLSVVHTEEDEAKMLNDFKFISRSSSLNPELSGCDPMLSFAINIKPKPVACKDLRD